MIRFPLAIALILSLALPAFALSDTDRAAIQAHITTFETGLANEDYSVFFAAVPPKITAKIAELSGQSVETIDAQMKAQFAQAMAQVTMVTLDMATDKMETGETSAGRAYAKIPTSMVMEVPKLGKFRTTNTTLALEDAGHWYLVRIDSPQQIMLLTLVYPDFKGIDFPQGTMQATD